MMDRAGGSDAPRSNRNDRVGSAASRQILPPRNSARPLRPGSPAEFRVCSSSASVRVGSKPVRRINWPSPAIRRIHRRCATCCPVGPGAVTTPRLSWMRTAKACFRRIMPNSTVAAPMISKVNAPAETSSQTCLMSNFS